MIKEVFAEIVTIGDEILYGQITDTNSQWISTELDKIGVRVRRKSSVGDNENDILQILSEAENRASIILITGGLGPTNDDITKKTLAKYFDSKLILNEEALSTVTEFFNKRGRILTDINKQQAYLPDKCEYIENKNGTAPGMLFRRNNKIFISMPGVPFEMKAMVSDSVIPVIRKEFSTPLIVHKVIKTTGLGESYLAETIKDWEEQLPSHLKLAYLPSYSEVKLRITGTGTDATLLHQEIDQQVLLLQKIIPQYIFGYDQEVLEKVLGNLLQQNGKTIAVAESCTGGFVSHLITSIPGSSGYFNGSIVAYSNLVKQEVLGIDKDILEKFGAVSEETIKQMAEKVRLALKADIGIATSGIAGPTGGSAEKPVGTIWISCSDGQRTISKKLTYGSLREVNIRLTAIAVLNMARKFLLGIQD